MELQGQMRALEKQAVAAQRHKAKAVAAAAALEGELTEDLSRRRDKLLETSTRLEAEHVRRQQRLSSGKWERGDAGQDGLLKDAETDADPTHVVASEGPSQDLGNETAESNQEAVRLKELQAELARVAAACAEDAQKVKAARIDEVAKRAAVDIAKAAYASAVARRDNESKEADALRKRRLIARRKLEEAENAQQGLGPISAVELESGAESLRGLSASAVWKRTEKISEQLSLQGHVNKKALDQYAVFLEQRETLRGLRREVDEAETAIGNLIAYLDEKKEAALQDLFVKPV